MRVATGFIWVVKNCYKMLNGCFENRPKCESPANENAAGYYILSGTDVILRSLMVMWVPQEICKRTKVRECIIDNAVNGKRAQCVANYIIV